MAVTAIEELLWDGLVDRLDRLVIGSGNPDIDPDAFAASKHTEEIKLTLTDFQEHELPAMQMYDLVKLYEPERNRSRCRWEIRVEVLFKTSDGFANQKLLQKYLYQVERTMGTKVQLGVTSKMIHIVPIRSITDLALVDSLALGWVDFRIDYFKPYVSDC